MQCRRRTRKLLAYGVYVEKAVQPWKIAIVSSEGGEPLKLLDLSLFRSVKRWTSDSKSLMYDNTQPPQEKFGNSQLTVARLRNYSLSQMNGFTISLFHPTFKKSPTHSGTSRAKRF